MRERDFKRLLRRIVLGVSATPLMLLPGCGRSQLVGDFAPDASVIPSQDSGVIIRRDAGVDAGVMPDAGMDGGWNVLWSDCGLVRTPDGVFLPDSGVMLSAADCVALCGPSRWNGFPVTECTAVSATELACWDDFCAIGRLAEGVASHWRGAALTGAFANMASHEAAAVVAFEQLAEEVRVHSLPESLRRGALRAANEERRHTRLVGGLAHQLGGQFGISRERPTELRSLEALALDNAVEGCVRETFGAMIGAYQSEHARDPQVRAVLASVAEDELGHGAWSWTLGEELERRLPVSSRRRVREARDEALASMAHGLLARRTSLERRELGLPDESRLETMASALRKAMF